VSRLTLLMDNLTNI